MGYTPEDAGNKSVTFASDPEGILSISADGSVTGLAEGKAVVVATAADGSGVTARSSEFTVIDSGVTTKKVTGLAWNTSTDAMIKGGSYQFTVSITPTDASDKSMTWASSDPNVVTVNSSGYAVAKASGTAKITATSNSSPEISVEKTVTVTNPVTNLTWDNVRSEMTVGGSSTFSVKVTPSDADDATVTWSSSATDVATVDANGTVTAESAGETTITATSNADPTKKVTQKVTVSEAVVPVDDVTIDKYTETMQVGGKAATFTAVVTPENADDKGITWSSSKPEVATVNASTGVVTAVASGTTYITATSTADNTKSDRKLVTVTTPVTAVTVTDYTEEIRVGEGTKTFKAKVEPENADDKGITWSSSKPEVATVDASTGVVTAVASGTTYITATSTADSTKTDRKLVTVTTPVTGIKWINIATSVKLGETAQFTASVLPEAADDKGVNYSTDKPSIATVDASGVVTGVAVGTATITASSSADTTKKVTQEITVTKDAVMVTAVKITEYTSDIRVGEGTKTFKAKVEPEDADDTGIMWSSDNEAVATVDASTGEVTPVSTGTANITVKSTADNTKYDTKPVTVTVPVESLSWKEGKHPATMEQGSTSIFEVTLLPENASDRSVTWSSDNEAVATVDQASGKVTAVSAGTAKITATTQDTTLQNKKLSVSQPVTVFVPSIPVEEVVWTHTVEEIRMGETPTFEAVVKPQDADDTGVTYSSSDTSILEIDETSGQVTVKGSGSATVTATSTGDLTKSVSIVVSAIVPVKNITLSESELGMTLKTGKEAVTQTLTYELTPAGATNKKVQCNSSEPTVATAALGDRTVTITAVSPGTATVTVTTEDGNHTANCVVTVKGVPVSSIDLSKCPDEIEQYVPTDVGEIVKPSDAEKKAVIYTCVPEGAITFDNGKMYGQKVGTATITVSATDGSGVYARKEITVRDYVGVTGLKCDEIEDFKLRIGGDEKDKTHQCDVTALPENASNPMINWESEDTGVATVENGLVTAVGKGTTHIIARSDDNPSCYRQYYVTVERAVTGITWENEATGSIIMNRGDEKKLSVVVSPTTADNTWINWKSDDKRVVTVDDLGYVNAVGAGTTNVWAVSDDNPNLSVSMEITVIVPVKEVVASCNTLTLGTGETATVNAWVSPEDTTENKTITWESADPSIATVEDGVITAKIPGTTKIIAKNNASGKYAEIAVTVDATAKPKVTVAVGTAKLINRAYDGTADMKTEGMLEVTGIPEGSDIRVDALPETVQVGDKNAGEKTYVLKIKLEGEDADKVELVTESIELKGIISKKGVTLADMKFKPKYYDGSKYMVLTSTKGVITGGVIDGDDVAFETKQDNYVITGTKNAGDKKRKLTRGLWSVTGKDAANYQVAAGPIATGTIKKITVKKVTLKKATVTYVKGKAQKPVISSIVGDNGSKILQKNCKVQYYRNGKATTDFTSKGVITVKVTGVGSADTKIGRNWSGSVSVKYTIK